MRRNLMELDKELGPVLTVNDMSKLLGVCENTVRNHHKRWGGVEVTPGKYHFFENVVRKKIYADIGDTGEGEEEAQILERRSDGQRGPERATLSRGDSGGKAGGDSVGERNKGKIKAGGDPKRHGLI
jgi:hypothetical protein